MLGRGGQPGIGGNMSAVYDGLRAAAASPWLVGVGLAMEGTAQNLPVYEYTLSFAWGNATVTPGGIYCPVYFYSTFSLYFVSLFVVCSFSAEYLYAYSLRRYGTVSTSGIIDAWRTLADTAYSAPGSDSGSITHRPVLASPANEVIMVYFCIHLMNDTPQHTHTRTHTHRHTHAIHNVGLCTRRYARMSRNRR